MIDDNTIYGVAVTQPNPSDKSLTKTQEKVKSQIPKYWTKEEIQAKLAAITNHKDKMLCQYLWMSGVRITEALNLKKQEIDFQNYTMRIRWLKSRKYYERIVPLHPQLKDILQLYTAPMNQEELVFPYSRQRGWQIIRKWMQGHPHQFRHSFAVFWLRSGGDLVTLHRILGHSRIQTTMEYLKIVPVDIGKDLIKLNFW
jgi:integrase/recombinase XerD